MDRLTQLRERLDASLKDGKPKVGYGQRVIALRAEIARLETARAGASKDPAESNPEG